jgi:molecular chaperone DnaK
MGKIVGIDLGTTNSVVAVHEGNQTKVIINALGSRITPSVVAYTDDGRIVGQPAKSQAAVNPQCTISSIKRFMGRSRQEVGSEEAQVPYKLVGGVNESVRVNIDGKLYAPPEISAAVLMDLKKSAEAYLGEKITGAVITVPAYFNDAQRQATKEAGLIAGLKVERILNEPTAAALAYGVQENAAKSAKSLKVAVFDLGGGTFDISVLDVSNGVFEVLATNGDTHLGGDDWDRAVVDHIANDFKTKHGIDLRKDPLALQRLTEAAEKAKCDLSNMPQTQVLLPYIASGEKGAINLQFTLTRATFEQICKRLFDGLRGPVEKCLADAKMKPADVDEVVLVGGSTRMPQVKAICKELFGREPNQSVNPDEVVAVGAAIQGAVMTGAVTDLVLLDVTPLSLGIKTQGDVMTVLIPRNTTIPTQKTEPFTTASDNQPAVDVHVLQGERRMADGNRLLGQFCLSGIPPAARGVPRIEVTFEIDANGILNVTAKDQATGKAQKIEVKASSGLDKSEIEKMVQAAKASEAEDTARAALAEARNKADQLAWDVERIISESASKVDAALVEAANKELATVRLALTDGSSKDDLEHKTAVLRKAVHAVTEALYAAAQGKQAPQQTQPAQEEPAKPAGTPSSDFPSQEEL